MKEERGLDQGGACDSHRVQGMGFWSGGTSAEPDVAQARGKENMGKARRRGHCLGNDGKGSEAGTQGAKWHLLGDEICKVVGAPDYVGLKGLEKDVEFCSEEERSTQEVLRRAVLWPDLSFRRLTLALREMVYADENDLGVK